MEDNSLIFSSDEISRWNVCIDQYFASRNNNTEICQNIFDAYVKSIVEILLKISRKVAPSDKFTPYLMGDTVIMRSGKLKHDFSIVVCLKMRFSIDTELVFPQNIAYMTDEFWSNIIELNRFGRFRYQKNRIFDIPGSINHKVLKRERSNIFSMMHNYILLMTQELEEINNYEKTFPCDYGNLEVSWPIDIEFEDFLNNCHMVFKRFYRMNYLLYRRQYIADTQKSNP